ncbi:hypothetical protein ACG74X_19175 [Marivita sp. S0852]|uniref:hypothetical protein n=1 Tax=Marivita sp. S0852 TaxID=3373893 RepID=UPI00398210A6
MSSRDVVQESQDNLIQALDSGVLSDALAAQGREILANMQQVLRLSVLGLPDAGKSTLMNLLLGKNVIPDGLYLPTLSFQYGETPQAKCTMPNGDIEVLDDIDLNAIAKRQPVFVDLSLPLPALRKLSMMEVVVGSDLAEQQRAVKWATKRTDIALWCTQYCDPVEETLWTLLPDHLLDHSFLMLTKTDELAANGTLSEYSDRAQTLGSETFYKTLPIDTLAAVNARHADGTVDKQALRASGGMALISAILREVEIGQRAAADAADIFLRQIDFDPETWAPAKDIAPNLPAQDATEDTAAPPETAPKTVPSEAAPTDPDESQTADPDLVAGAAPTLSVAARAACTQVVDQLIAEGNALAHQLENDEINQATVVDVSVDTVTWIADYLAEASSENDPVLEHTCDMANDAADLVQLIKLEKGDTVALDALSLMIQLKHEIQAELAA